MKWCCMGFEAHVLAAGSRGSGVFVSMREDHKPIFVLQYRALDLGRPFRIGTHYCLWSQMSHSVLSMMWH
jgi:hypothetical protein